MATVVPCLLAMGLSGPAVAGKSVACDVNSGRGTIPLVELYTSEGCNNCPPADDWLSRLAQEEDPAVTSLLAFHVDYWDEIGWIDRFADPAYSQRQRARIKLDKGKTVYTPQVMLGDKTMLDWRDDRQARRTLRTARKEDAPVDLLMRVVVEDGRVRVGVKAAPVEGKGPEGEGMLWLALYQDGLTSQVSAGENEGRTLTHDRVVRELKGPWALSAQPVMGETVFQLPDDVEPRHMGLVLFAESSETGAGWQSVNMPLAACM